MNKKINRKKRNIFYVICNPEDLNEDVYIPDLRTVIMNIIEYIP